MTPLLFRPATADCILSSSQLAVFCAKDNTVHRTQQSYQGRVYFIPVLLTWVLDNTACDTAFYYIKIIYGE